MRPTTILLWLLASAALLPASAGAQATAGAPAAVGAPAPARGRAAAASAPPAVDVNSASEAALDALPGVGPVRGKAIVANRPYAEKLDLVTKKAIPASLLAGIQDKIALVNVNATAAADMARILPNVGPVRAQQIVDKRPYATLDDLVTKGALTAGILAGIRNLITTGS